MPFTPQLLLQFKVRKERTLSCEILVEFCQILFQINPCYRLPAAFTGILFKMLSGNIVFHPDGKLICQSHSSNDRQRCTKHLFKTDGQWSGGEMLLFSALGCTIAFRLVILVCIFWQDAIKHDFCQDKPSVSEAVFHKAFYNCRWAKRPPWNGLRIGVGKLNSMQQSMIFA